MRSIVKIFCFLLLDVGMLSLYFLELGENNTFKKNLLWVIVIINFLIFAIKVPDEIRYRSKILRGEKKSGKVFFIFWSVYSFVSNLLVMVLSINIIVLILSIVPMFIIDNYVENINYYWMLLMKIVFGISLVIGAWLSYSNTKDELSKIVMKDNGEDIENKKMDDSDTNI